jgi:hypothetical protein
VACTVSIRLFVYQSGWEVIDMELCPLHPVSDLEDRHNNVEGSSPCSG